MRIKTLRRILDEAENKGVESVGFYNDANQEVVILDTEYPEVNNLIATIEKFITPDNKQINIALVPYHRNNYMQKGCPLF